MPFQVEPDAPGRFRNVGLAEDAPDRTNTGNGSVGKKMGIAGLNSANSDTGQGRIGSQRRESPGSEYAAGRGFGRAPENRSEANVVRPLLESLQDLRARFCCRANDFVTNQIAGLANSHVRLAEMNSLGINLEHDINAIVDNQWNAAG